MNDTKWCPACKSDVPRSEFTTAPSKPDGLWQYCRPCDRVKKREHAQTPKGREGQARRMRRYRYGLEPEDYARLVAEYPSCPICGVPFGETTPCVDHDHKTEKVRGLLCDVCNRGIGYFADDPARLAAAISYLESGE